MRTRGNVCHCGLLSQFRFSKLEGEGSLKLQKWPIELLCLINGNFAVVVALVIVVTIVVV